MFNIVRTVNQRLVGLSRQRPQARFRCTQTGSEPELLQQLRSGNRRALAKAITLGMWRSIQPKGVLAREEEEEVMGPAQHIGRSDRQEANALVEAILGRKGAQESNGVIDTFRIGLSGPPGVGKSSFIETFGLYLLGAGHKVAVLAVDPSSARTGGSILGDKTRMIELSKAPNAYVRPSPSSGTLGGVTAHTNEAILLLEEAGYDIILVETVGVGQSETAVEGMVDMFCLLVSPAGGDDLQGIKRGIMELADMVVVNKADGELLNVAKRTQFDYLQASKFLRPKQENWRTKVSSCSSLTGDNIDKVWDIMKEYWKVMEGSGDLSRKRAHQRKSWMWSVLRDEIEQKLISNEDVKQSLPILEQQVYKGEVSPTVAAKTLVKHFFSSEVKLDR